MADWGRVSPALGRCANKLVASELKAFSEAADMASTYVGTGGTETTPSKDEDDEPDKPAFLQKKEPESEPVVGEQVAEPSSDVAPGTGEADNYDPMDLFKSYVNGIADNLQALGKSESEAWSAIEAHAGEMEGVGQMPPFPADENDQDAALGWLAAAQQAGFEGMLYDKLGLSVPEVAGGEGEEPSTSSVA